MTERERSRVDPAGDVLAGLPGRFQIRSDKVIIVTILQTLTVFVGIPVLIYALIAVFTLIPGRAEGKPASYRPGAPWEYPSQWWAGDHPVVSAGAPDGARRTGGGARGTW